MASAAEGSQAVVQRSGTPNKASTASLLALASVALGLTLLAGNCFLKYLWWAANASAWQGIPKHAEQWRTAAARTSFYGWSLVVLEIGSISLNYSLIRLRSLDSAKLLRNAVRLAASLIITIAGTALLALVLSWIEQRTP